MSGLGKIDIMSWIFRGGFDQMYNWAFPPPSAWGAMNEVARQNLIFGTSIAACHLVLLGEVYDVHEVFTEVMPEMINETYIGWKQDSHNNGWAGDINQAQSEVVIAKSITDQASTSETLALSRLEKADFRYVSKSQVHSIIVGEVYDPSTDTQINSSQANVFSGMIDWAKQNPILATVLGLAAAAGIFIAVNSDTKQLPASNNIKNQQLK